MIKANKWLINNQGFLIGLITISLCSLAALNFVLYQFGGYDLSPLIDLSWRLSRNEVPGIDFINTFPLAILICIKIVSWGNLHWIDLTVANIIATIFTYLMICYMNRAERISKSWYFLTVLIISMPLVYTNHLWHSSLSQLIGIIFFYSIYIAMVSPALRRRDFFLIIISSALLAISKQNIALPFLIASICFILLFVKDKRLFITTALLIGPILGISVSLIILGASLDSFIYSYIAVLGRGKLDPAMWMALKLIKLHIPLAICSIALLVITVLSLLNFNKNNRRVQLYIFLVLTLSMIPIYTDWDTKFNNASLPLFISMVAIRNSNNWRWKKISLNLSSLLIIYIFFVALYGGFKRERMMHVGPFFELPLESQIRTGYFNGLHTGATFENILKEINTAISSTNESSIFFGPRIEFAYMSRKIDSPKGMPLWFHPGTSYANFDEEKVAIVFEELQLKTLIFAKNDRSRMSKKILDYIEQNYLKLDDYKFIDVYLKK